MQNVFQMQFAGSSQLVSVWFEVSIVESRFFLPAECCLSVHEVGDGFTVLTNVGQRPIMLRIVRMGELLLRLIGAWSCRPDLAFFVSLPDARRKSRFFRPPGV